MLCNFVFGKCRRQIVASFFFPIKMQGSLDCNQHTAASVGCQPTANCSRPHICGVFFLLIPAVCCNVQEDRGMVLYVMLPPLQS